MRTPLIVLAVFLVASTEMDAGAAKANFLLEQVRTENRENLGRLSIGMEKQKVLEIMGTETVKYRKYFIVNNPFRTEIMISADGKTTLEVLFYYTDKKRADRAITADELTPLVLKEGKLIGWGQSFTDQTKEIYELRIR